MKKPKKIYIHIEHSIHDTINISINNMTKLVAAVRIFASAFSIFSQTTWDLSKFADKLKVEGLEANEDATVNVDGASQLIGNKVKIIGGWKR